MSEKEKKTAAKPRGRPPKRPKTGFEAGADFLKVSVGYLVEIYSKNLDVVKEGMRAGKVNIPMGVAAELAYLDLLHGGAYTVPLQQRPYSLAKVQSGAWPGSISKYDPGAIVNLPSEGIANWLESVFGGSLQNTADLTDEVFVNANCPHVFPKLLSDQAYAVDLALLTYSSQTDIFKSGATGLKVLVEAGQVVEKTAAAAANETLNNMRALLPLLGTAAP